MRKLLIGVASLALVTACTNEAETEDPEMAEIGEDGEPGADGIPLTGEEPGFEAVAPGTYEVTRAGGEVDYIEIHEGMTFSRVDADGNATGGVIFMKDGQICFLVEGAEEEDCFTDGPRQEDGSLQTTSATGDTSTVRPVDGALEDHVEETA